MKTADINQRSKILSNACLKLVFHISNEHALCPVVRSKLIDCASSLAVKTKMLMSPQPPEYFLKTLYAAKQDSDSCSYWLELILSEKLMDENIVKPIFEESQIIGGFLGKALIKLGDRSN